MKSLMVALVSTLMLAGPSDAGTLEQLKAKLESLRVTQMGQIMDIVEVDFSEKLSESDEAKLSLVDNTLADVCKSLMSVDATIVELGGRTLLNSVTIEVPGLKR